MSEHKWSEPISDEQIGYIPTCLTCGAEWVDTKPCGFIDPQLFKEVQEFIATQTAKLQEGGK